MAAAIAALTVAGPAYATLQNLTTSPAPGIVLTPPEILGGWHLVRGSKDSWQPSFPGADATLRQTYEKAGRRIHLYLAYFRLQRQGAELISQSNDVSGGKRWESVGSGGATAPIGGSDTTVRREIVVGRGGRRLVWNWYWLDGVPTASGLTVKWMGAQDRLLGRSRPSAAIAISTDFDDVPAEAVPALRDFVRNLGALESVLRGSTR